MKLYNHTVFFMTCGYLRKSERIIDLLHLVLEAFRFPHVVVCGFLFFGGSHGNI